MEKGHFGGYTGNARHSRKEEMIHDRELIYDAKKQLHHADQDYKSDSPAHRALVGNQDRLPGHLKKAISDAPAQMNADPVNDRADSPMFNLNKGYTPLLRLDGAVAEVFDNNINVRARYKGTHPDSREIATGVPSTPSSAPTVPSDTKKESFGVPSGTSAGADRRERRLGKAERKASVSTGKTKARLEKKADRIKRRQTIKGDGLQSKPTVKPSGGSGSKSSSGLGGSGGSGSGSRNSGNTNINTITINGKKQ